jgi:two-component system chemotaxis response regulator CheB
VDDSVVVRKIIAEAISNESDLEVVGTAPDPIIAREKLPQLKPDVLTLDIEMPRMDGLTFLKQLMRENPLPVIVISSLGQASCRATLEALEAGAVEVLAKPAGPYSIGDLRTTLGAKIRAAAAARIRPAAPKGPLRSSLPSTRTFRPGTVIALGASTGGTEALYRVLKQMPAESPGIVITQHIPPVFSTAFAARLNQACAIEVKEAADGDTLTHGRALLAPGNFHMVLQRSGETYRVRVKDGPQVCYQRPSVDVMFASVAAAAGARTVAALLTGMGNDGAQGLLQLKKAGAATMVQDEASCVVFGMPKEAIRLGAADRAIPLDGIAAALLREAATR